MPLSFNLSLLLYGWFVLFVLQLAVGPVLVLRAPALFDRGWAFGRLIGWLIVSLVIWNLAHLKLPVNTQVGIWISFIGLILIAGVINFKQRQQFKIWFKKFWPIIFLEEILFLVGFVGFGLIRSFNPNIMDLEKFMDAGFIASYLRSPVLPMEDMWLAGSTVNYYTFGHFMGAVMSRIWAVDVNYAYNLLLALIFALTLTGGFSFVFNLSQQGAKKLNLSGIFAGLIAGAALVFGGNSQALWFWLKNQTLTNYWYADATRFIDFTIHEFPAYSFIVSDLHAHVWSLPLVLLFLTLVLVWQQTMIDRGTNYRLSAIIGALIGVMAMTNTWDVMVYGSALSLFSVYLLLKRVSLTKLLFHYFWIGFWAAAAALFWFLNFTSISSGVFPVPSRSPLWQLAVLWSGHLVLGLMALAFAVKLSGKHQVLKLKQPLVLILFLVALGFILLPEIIYFKDIYPSHPRANTMFKLTYQAFILLTLLSGWLMGRLWQLGKSRYLILRLGLAVCASAIMAGLFLFPYTGYQSYYRQFETMNYLDGLTWMKTDLPDDYQAIVWLKQNVKGRPVILEAVGESYTTFARISANTGLPTVLGWRVHEWLWRNSFEEAAKRTGEVRTIYERPRSLEAAQAMELYQVRYIIIGQKEWEIYQLNEKDLLNLGTVVFTSGRTKIVAL